MQEARTSDWSRIIAATPTIESHAKSIQPVVVINSPTPDCGVLLFANEGQRQVLENAMTNESLGDLQFESFNIRCNGRNVPGLVVTQEIANVIAAFVEAGNVIRAQDTLSLDKLGTHPEVKEVVSAQFAAPGMAR